MAVNFRGLSDWISDEAGFYKYEIINGACGGFV
jgi:hypothetical protein